MIDPNAHQIGGDHYQTDGLQHWDLIALIRGNYFVGCITKYLARYQHKNGLEDLEKAKHFAEKYAVTGTSDWQEIANAIHESHGLLVRRRYITNYLEIYDGVIKEWIAETAKRLTLSDEEYQYFWDAMVATFYGEPAFAVEHIDNLIRCYREATEPTTAYIDQ